jgi:N-acetylglucosamine kinase-like BadF-type ATPase
MKLYVGIDGGQTATKCVVADEEGHILGFSVGGPCRHLRDEQSRDQVKQALGEVVQSALRSAGGPGASRIISAFLGISGVAGPQAPAGLWLQEFFSRRFNPEIVAIDHDARSALAGAIPSMIGVTVIAGTGSIAFGRNSSGEEMRAGGWGYLIGDAGSAFEIGRQAIAAVLRAEEGFGPATSLRESVLQRMGIEGTDLIPETIHQSNEAKLRVAEIGSAVSEQAQMGDTVALRIIKTAGGGLAELAGAVISRLFRQAYPVTVSGVGGVLDSGELIWKVFADEVASRWPASKIDRAVFPPWIGAVILAYHNAGSPVSDAAIESLRQSTPYGSLSS